MKNLSPRLLSLSALVAAVAVTGCSKNDRVVDSGTPVKDAYADTKTAMSNGWNDVKSFSFDKRDDFQKSASAMSTKLDAQLSEVRANYSDAKASASRKAAMEELKNSEADYKEKAAALGNATSATWDSAKQNVIAAWERTEAAYAKARAE